MKKNTMIFIGILLVLCTFINANKATKKVLKMQKSKNKISFLETYLKGAKGGYSGSDFGEDIGGWGAGLLLDTAWSLLGNQLLINAFGIDPENKVMNYLGWGGSSDNTIKTLEKIEKNLDIISNELNDLSQRMDEIDYAIYDKKRRDIFNTIYTTSKKTIKLLGEVAKKYSEGQTMSDQDFNKCVSILEDWAIEHLGDALFLIDFLKRPFKVGEKFVEHYDNYGIALLPNYNGYAFRQHLRNQDIYAVSQSALLAMIYYKVKGYDTSFKTILNATKDFNEFMEKNDDTSLLIGFQKINNSLYYFDLKTGERASGVITALRNGAYNEYYFDPETGKCKTGWILSNNKWYYFQSLDKDLNGGKALRGWQQLNWSKGTSWFYFDKSTSYMHTGLQTLDWREGTDKFYFDPVNGDMKTGWVYANDKWYYFQPSDGKALKGWQQLKWSKGTSWFYFDSQGQMLTGLQTLDWRKGTNKFYFDPVNGDMKTGWVNVNGKTHYFDGVNGYMKQ